jgi:hypothetical protein
MMEPGVAVPLSGPLVQQVLLDQQDPRGLADLSVPQVLLDPEGQLVYLGHRDLSDRRDHREYRV